jgi:hypothetical protein
MGRPIDADKLCESLIENISWLREQDYETYCAVGDAIVFVTDQQPTAYDPNNVVKQLEDYLFEKYCVEGDYEIERIVKGGGVDIE